MSRDLSGARVFVTGATGFIGANLTRALVERDAEVHALVRPGASLDRIAAVVDELQLHDGDLTHAEEVDRAVRAARPDVLVHLAAPGGHPRDAPARATMLRGIVSGTANLLQAAARVRLARLVHVGGSLEYGHKRRPIRETDRLEPVTFRGAAKAAATLLALQFAREADRPVTILRPFSIYGPWEDESRFVPRAVLAALDGAELPLAEGPRRDFLFVGDLVEATFRAASTDLPPGEILNVGSGQETSNEELVRSLARATGMRIAVRPGAFERRPWDTESWVADISKAERLLGWRPARSLEQGLRETFAWFGSRRAVAR